METYLIVIIIICAIAIFLYLKNECQEYFSQGLLSEESTSIDDLMELWKPLFKQESKTDDLKKAIVNYSTSKHNIQLKKLSLDKFINDDNKKNYWIDDNTSNYIDISATDNNKLTNFENTIALDQEATIIQNLKAISKSEISGATLDEIKKNLQYHGCLIKQKVLGKMVQDNKILAADMEKAWFNC
jgi:hypothetical protein